MIAQERKTRTHLLLLHTRIIHLPPCHRPQHRYTTSPTMSQTTAQIHHFSHHVTDHSTDTPLLPPCHRPQHRYTTSPTMSQTTARMHHTTTQQLCRSHRIQAVHLIRIYMESWEHRLSLIHQVFDTLADPQEDVNSKSEFELGGVSAKLITL